MRHWSARFRRATLLLSVHLLQVILLAASAVCDVAPSAAPTTASIVADATRAQGDGHAHHGDTRAPSTPATPHHESHTTACPMAMACASSAFMAPLPVVVSREVAVESARIGNDSVELRSMHLAPEPPPPRG